MGPRINNLNAQTKLLGEKVTVFFVFIIVLNTSAETRNVKVVKQNLAR